MPGFPTLLASHAAAIEDQLVAALGETPLAGEILRPERLMQAMRYSVLDGGKRLRPFLLIESAGMFGVDIARSVHTAAALELIHCYSLVHDDLPTMDDDDLRRGKPTTHRAFDEATAILAGDALLTLTFDLLCDEATHPESEIRTSLVTLFARNAGAGGMVGGQVLDLAGEGKNLTQEEIHTLQLMKTGALMRCACEAGAILGGANPSERRALTNFGTAIGLAFQLVDDILDITSSAGVLGKNTAKDQDRGKATLITGKGIKFAKTRARQLLKQAIQHLAQFGQRADTLTEAAKFIVERNR